MVIVFCFWFLPSLDCPQRSLSSCLVKGQELAHLPWWLIVIELAPAHSWKRTWICLLPKQRRDTDPLSRTCWGPVGHSLRSYGVEEVVGYWNLSEVIKGSFHGEVLPGACAQGQLHCQLIGSVSQSLMQSTGTVYPGLHAPVSTPVRFPHNAASAFASSGVLSMCPWAGATGEDFSSLLWRPWVFLKGGTSLDGSGFYIAFQYTLPYCGLLIIRWIIL